MAIFQTPPPGTAEPASPRSARATQNPASIGSRKAGQISSEAGDAPVLLIQLQDDLARSRMREAFWMSLVVHLLTLIALVFAPKYLSVRRAVAVATPAELLRDKELTYLDLPKDTQKPPRKPESKHLSDKDRIATSRR
ncbi:MAG TPA: hypothetical protein VFG86_13120, partial [Chloroflexota bacterium]|nr:hypothetical protein [Chloroflexota bacterium]